MRIAFVGKGGSGKTTAAAAFSRHLAASGRRVLAVDADINQHLGAALGYGGAPPRALGADLGWLKEHLRGTNPRLPRADEMIKTTPPGRGSRLVDLGADDAVLRRFAVATPDGVRLLVAGAFAADDVGVACYHAKTGAVELYLNHLVDRPGEYVVVDMTAGADAFASGLFTRFDLTVLVSEPTRRGVAVYRQYAELAAGHGVALAVLGNKVADAADVEWLHGEVGAALLGCLSASAWVRAAERGAPAPFAELEADNRAVLADVRAALDARERDWAAYHRTTVAAHRANATAWAGADRIAQIDPDFVPACEVLPCRSPSPPPSSTPPSAARSTTPSSSTSSARRCPTPGTSSPRRLRTGRRRAPSANTRCRRRPRPSADSCSGSWPATRSAARWNATTAWCSPSRTATAWPRSPPAAVDGAAYRAFVSPRAQLLHQSPELRDC